MAGGGCVSTLYMYARPTNTDYVTYALRARSLAVELVTSLIDEARDVWLIYFSLPRMRNFGEETNPEKAHRLANPPV